jgi:signal transduction histidine kinase
MRTRLAMEGAAGSSWWPSMPDVGLLRAIGMGLSICRSIIDAHGGRLWVSSCEPHGTVFRFTVPIGVVT